MFWLVLRCMAAELLMPANDCLFVFLYSSFVAVIKHLFCYGDAIPYLHALLRPWELRLVTPVQNNEHEALIPSPTAQEQCQNKLGV